MNQDKEPLFKGSCGLCLRDYFAANALQGLLAKSHITVPRNPPIEDYAIDAYLFADAMLAQREKEA